MNKYDFTSLVKEPNKMGDPEIEKLKALVNQFPYFSIAQNLLVKALGNSKHYEFDKYLNQAALQAGSRSVLYNLVHDLPLETESAEFLDQKVENLQINVPVQEEIPQITPSFDAIEIVEQEPTLVDERLVQEEIIEVPFIPEIVPAVETETIAEQKQPIPEERITPAPPIVKRDPDKIDEDEKLVQATGSFVKFIPKPKVKEEDFDDLSLIQNLGNDEDFVLGDFDISSLDSFAPDSKIQRPHYEEEPIEIRQKISEEIIEPSEKSFVFNDSKEPELNTPVTLTEEIKELNLVVSPTVESTVADENFLNWISNKEEETEKTESVAPIVVSESTSIPEKREEDHVFVQDFYSKLAENSQIHLTDSITSYLPTEAELKAQKLVVPDEPIKVQELEKVEAPIAKKSIQTENFESDLTESANHLQSLFNYEVNEFLAPLYKQVSYNENLFENSFEVAFGNGSAKTVEWTEPFVSLKPVEGAKQEDIIPEPKKPIIKASLNEVKPKISDQPAPKIARDPGTVESILEKFMRENPSIARPKSEFYSPMNMAKQSAEESEEIISETLAQIYTRQGLYKKAILMYEKLGLHFPEKLPYFAGLILQIKSAHNID